MAPRKTSVHGGNNLRLGDSTRIPIPDAIGSPRQSYNDAGQVTNLRMWSPFGEPMTLNPSAGIGYAGEWQEANGLVYLRARWYDPAQGQFLSRDPWAGTIIRPETRNPYAYPHHQPTRLTDRSGRWVDEQGNWHACTLLTETASCVDQLPGWFKSNEPAKAWDFTKGVVKGIWNAIDPIQHIKHTIALINAGPDAVWAGAIEEAATSPEIQFGGELAFASMVKGKGVKRGNPKTNTLAPDPNPETIEMPGLKTLVTKSTSPMWAKLQPYKGKTRWSGAGSKTK